MAGKVKRTVRLASGDIVEVMVRPGASKTEMLAAVETAARRNWVTSVTSGLADVSKNAQALTSPDFRDRSLVRPDRRRTLGGKPTVKFAPTPVDRGFADRSRDRPDLETYASAPSPERLRVLEAQEERDRLRQEHPRGAGLGEDSPLETVFKHGFSWGGSDEAAGAAGTLLDPTNPIEAYETARDLKMDDIYRARSALGAWATPVELAGGIFGGGPGAIRTIGGLKGLTPKMWASTELAAPLTGRARMASALAPYGQAAKMGAIGGGVAGFNYGRGVEGSAMGAVEGAAIGSVLGPAVHGVSQFLRSPTFSALMADQRGVLMTDKYATAEQRELLKKAMQMKQAGATDSEIWQTGWHYLPFDQKWVFEVPDKGFEVDVDKLSKMEPGTGMDWRETIAHPGMENLLGDFTKPGSTQPLQVGPLFEATDPQGRYFRKEHGAQINVAGQDPRGTAMHEIGGHAFANVGGLLPGGSLDPANMVFQGPHYDKAWGGIEPKMADFIAQGGSLTNPQTPEEQDWVGKLTEAIAKSAQFEGYSRLPGENLAEANRLRLNLGEESRPTWNPALSMPYDYSRQINPKLGGFGPSGLPDPMQPTQQPMLTQPLTPEMSENPPDLPGSFQPGSIVTTTGGNKVEVIETRPSGLIRVRMGDGTIGMMEPWQLQPDEIDMAGIQDEAPPPIRLRPPPPAVAPTTSPIKIGGSTKLPDFELGYENPLNWRERVIDGGGVEIRPFQGNWHISGIRALEPGGGRRALEQVIAEADRLGITLDLTAEPLDTMVGKKMSKKDLVNWYKQFGFTGSADNMVRKPGGSGEMSLEPPELPGPLTAEDTETLPPNTIVVGNRLRSTVNSKGQPLGRDEEEIRNFWNWFGDSVATDENGLPKPWYHGSMRGNIESFERVGKAGYPSENTINAIGSWFTDDPNMSNIYAGASRPDEGFARYGENAPHGGTSYPVYLRMQNPRPLRGADSGGHDLRSLWREYAGGNGKTGAGEGDVDAFREYLSSHGYDSMWGKADDIEGGIGFGDNRDARYAIIPDQTSIKSVFNSGSFNPEDPRIQHSLEPPDGLEPFKPSELTPEQAGIQTWHGGPHDFDRFDSTKIGTGEGAQMYGHGLYLSEEKAVAESYVEQLRRKSKDLRLVGGGEGLSDKAQQLVKMSAGTPLHIGGLPDDEVARLMEKDIRQFVEAFPEIDPAVVEEAMQAIYSGVRAEPRGRLYETRIKADQGDFLDWDKPLAEQSEKVRAAIAKLPDRFRPLDDTEWNNVTGERFIRRLENAAEADARSGRDIYEDLQANIGLRDKVGPAYGGSYQDSAAAASGLLRDIGIPGIRYLDQQSRGSTEGTRNFVVFDDKLIDIVGKQEMSLEPPDPDDLPDIPDGLNEGRSTAVSRAFEGVTNYDDALKVAQAGGHLKADKSGKLIGSPDLSEADLEAWRGRLDQLIARAKMKGLGWYKDVRKVIGEVSETPEQASLLARGGAAYSPQASPSAETNFFLRHHNERVLSGEEPVITTGQRAETVNKGYGDVGDNTGYINLTPENINLGKKTGPYATSKDPTVPMGWEAASDLWHGRALEYPPNEGQAAFDRAFQDTEHAFIKGENILALERAKAAGTLPPDADVSNLQEVVWVQKRYETFMKEQTARYEAGKRKKQGPPTHEEAMRYALEGIRQGIDRGTAVVSREFTPGGGLGEFPGMSADKALNERFSTEMAAPGGDKSSTISALQMYQKPGVRGQGFWNDPVEGLQQNPAFMDRPLVGLSPEDVGGKPGGVAMAPRERNALLAVGRLFGLENVQHGVGANIFVPANSSHKASQLNGMYFGPATREAAMDRATRAGLDVVDNGDGGIVVTSFKGDAANKVKKFAPDLGGRLGRFDTNYAESGLSAWDKTAGPIDPKTGEPEGADVPRPHGTGIATKELLEATGSIPGFEQRLASSNYPQEVAERNAIRERYASELATSLRPDVQKLRDLLARGGPAAVREWVRVNGWKGLPAWASFLLGGELLVGATQDQEQAQPAL